MKTYDPSKPIDRQFKLPDLREVPKGSKGNEDRREAFALPPELQAMGDQSARIFQEVIGLWIQHWAKLAEGEGYNAETLGVIKDVCQAQCLMLEDLSAERVAGLFVQARARVLSRKAMEPLRDLESS